VLFAVAQLLDIADIKWVQLRLRWYSWLHKLPNSAIRRARSFKVTDFGKNRKPECDFLLY